MRSKKQECIGLVVLVVITLLGGVIVLARTYKELSIKRVLVEDRNPTGVIVDKGGVVVKASSASPSKAEPSGPVQIVRFTVYEDGLWPTEAYVSPGVVRIYFEDTTRTSAGLVVQTPLGISIGQAVRQPRLFRGSTQLNLRAGRYRIFDASRPRSSSTLIVQP